MTFGRAAWTSDSGEWSGEMRERLRILPNEEAVFGTWFCELSQGADRLPGKAAAAFLKRSGLPQQELRAIWDLCDRSAAGSIDQDEFFLAMRLIALAQNGVEASLPSCASFQVPCQRAFACTARTALCAGWCRPGANHSPPVAGSAADMRADEQGPFPAPNFSAGTVMNTHAQGVLLNTHTPATLHQVTAK